MILLVLVVPRPSVVKIQVQQCGCCKPPCIRCIHLFDDCSSLIYDAFQETTILNILLIESEKYQRSHHQYDIATVSLLAFTKLGCCIGHLDSILLLMPGIMTTLLLILQGF